MPKSTRNRGTRKTAQRLQKPRPDFPLFPHNPTEPNRARWAKKIKGRLHYFGKVADDPQGRIALNLYLDQKDDLLAGRIPRSKQDALTVLELCERFLEAKEARMGSGELAPATWKQYHLICKRILEFFGPRRLVEDLRGDDFDQFRTELAKTNGLVGLKNQITMTRMVFKYAADAELIERPVRFGANFQKPSAKAIRKQRTPRMFEAEDIGIMLDHAGPIMRAMMLLGVNAGFGPADIGRLPVAAVDFETGWITFARPKTGANRRVPLWRETTEALNEALALRPDPASDEYMDLVFLTKWGRSFFKESTRYLTEQFKRFLRSIDQQREGKAKREETEPPEKLYRKGRGFYTLRHVFETIGGESCDQVAVDAIMGHERGDMASVYRERISDDRLRNVVNYVHEWLFGQADDDAANEGGDVEASGGQEEKQERPTLRVVG